MSSASVRLSLDFLPGICRRTRFFFVLTLLIQGCAIHRPGSIYLEPPATEPAASPSPTLLAGTYGNRDGAVVTLTLQADGTYRREESFVLDLPDPDGHFPGWTNIEQGTWSLDGARVLLVPRDRNVQSPAAQNEDFDSHLVFLVRRYGGTLALQAENGPYYLLLKDTITRLYFRIRRSDKPNPPSPPLPPSTHPAGERP